MNAVGDFLETAVPYESLSVTVDRRVRIGCWVALGAVALLGGAMGAGAARHMLVPTSATTLVFRAAAAGTLGGLSLAVWTRGYSTAGWVLLAGLAGLLLIGTAAAVGAVIIAVAAGPAVLPAAFIVSASVITVGMAGTASAALANPNTDRR